MDDKGLIPELKLAKQMWPGLKQPQTAKPIISTEKLSAEKVLVTIKSSTKGASIGYKIEGDNDKWQIYDKPFEIHLDKGGKIKAKAIRIGHKESVYSSICL